MNSILKFHVWTWSFEFNLTISNTWRFDFKLIILVHDSGLKFRNLKLNLEILSSYIEFQDRTENFEFKLTILNWFISTILHLGFWVQNLFYLNSKLLGKTNDFESKLTIKKKIKRALYLFLLISRTFIEGCPNSTFRFNIIIK